MAESSSEGGSGDGLVGVASASSLPVAGADTQETVTSQQQQQQQQQQSKEKKSSSLSEKLKNTFTRKAG